MLMENDNRNVWGERKLVCAAVMTPANPALAAPIAKAITLYLRGLMPIDSAATSSSRIAVHDRPTRECSKREKMIRNNTTKPSVR